MSLFEFHYIGQNYTNTRRGLRLPLLLGRLHLGLIFSASTSSGRKCSSDKCTLRSFLFIATVLITKCGSSTFPNRTTNNSSNRASNLSRDVAKEVGIKHLDCDHQDFPLDLLLSQNLKSKSVERGFNRPFEEGRPEVVEDNKPHVKTLGYFLKGLILPMLISVTLAFGFVIYKNRLKQARLLAIQNTLEEARMNPQPLPTHLQRRASVGGLVSNALLSVLDARGEWSLITSSGNGGLILEGDDYIGEGGETARYRPYLHDKPPEYDSVFDPPTYEQATAISNAEFNFPKIPLAKQRQSVSLSDLPQTLPEEDDHLYLLSATNYSFEPEDIHSDDHDDDADDEEETKEDKLLVNSSGDNNK